MDAPTIGVEEEYQLVDPGSGALRSRAGRVLRTAWTDDLEPELQDTMLEIQTPPSASAEELDGHLRQRRLTAAATAATEGLEIVAAGTHPFTSWRGQRMATGERSVMLERRFGHVARSEHIFGTHVHVELPRGVDPARLMTGVRWISPLLVGLTASSPFFEGEDTGYASYRFIIQRRLPLTGPPPGLGTLSEHEALLDGLVDAGLIPDRRTIYWNIRLNPNHPTVEFRSPDACPTLDDVVAMAALVRAAVVHVAGGGSLLPDHADPPSAPGGPQLYLELNEWQAARFGMAGQAVHPSASPAATPLSEELHRLVDLLAPVAGRLGDGGVLERLLDADDRGSAADRMREIHDRSGDLVDVVDWLREESQLGLGRARTST